MLTPDYQLLLKKSELFEVDSAFGIFLRAPQLEWRNTWKFRLSRARGELSIFEWLLAGRPNVGQNSIQDEDPRATAVRLLSASMLISQNENFGLAKSVLEGNKRQTRYKKYLIYLEREY